MFRGPSRRQGPRREPPFPVLPRGSEQPRPLFPAVPGHAQPSPGHRVRHSRPAGSGNMACCGRPWNGPAGHSGLSSKLSPKRRVTSFPYS